ncbi:Uncharacterized protein APZ42_025567 [Daphnia magna]|uniref:Uncharacterized protein n=1 Tax=Daphnia magna TaxID=35525 RepID=A0A162DCW5_9CRUS|nr:Uncharacterized protein APZ42_025567 [Daphnia magna]
MKTSSFHHEVICYTPVRLLSSHLPDPLERVCSVRFLIDQGKMRDLVSLEVNKTLHGNSCVDTYYYMRALHEYGNRFNPSGTIA